MLRRCFLFLSKNLRKIIGSFVILAVIMFIMNVTIYLIGSLNALSSNDNYSMVNVTPNYDIMYSYESDSMEAEDFDYNIMYDRIKDNDELYSYRIDVGYNTIFFDTNNSPYSSTYLPIYDDKQADFVKGNAKLINGSIGDTGVVISEQYAAEYSVGVGDSISFVSQVDPKLKYGDFESYNVTVDSSEADKIDVEIIGIYRAEDFTAIEVDQGYYTDESVSDVITGPIYVGAKTANELNDSFEQFYNQNVENGSFGEEEFGEYNPFNDSQQFSRFFVEFTSDTAGDKFVADVEASCETCQVVDTTEQISNASKPVMKLRSGIIIFGLSIVIISLIGLYLNYYLLLEKRVNEIISLVSFGVSKVVLRIQSVVEMMIIVLIASPFAYLAFRYTITPIVAILEKYYYILVRNVMYSEEGNMMFFGEQYPYMEVNINDIVKFDEPNILSVVLLSLALTVLLVLISTVFEMSRRIRMYIRN